MHSLPHFLSFFFLPLILKVSNHPDMEKKKKRNFLHSPCSILVTPLWGPALAGASALRLFGKTIALSIGFDSSWVFGSLWDLEPSPNSSVMNISEVKS